MSIIKAVLKNILSSFGYNVYSKNVTLYNNDSMKAGLERMKVLKILPNTVVDIGAAVGGWTRIALEIWSSAKYELLEPLAEMRDSLANLKSQYPNINYHEAVAGESAGEIIFDVSPDLYGSGIYGASGANGRKVPVLTIDEIVKDTPGPIMIKLDTHGYELPILKGAEKTLERTSLLVIEVYGFPVSPTCLLFHEISNYLSEKGFRLIDIVDVMRRPADNAFWQADAFYIRKDHEVFLNNHFR